MTTHSASSGTPVQVHVVAYDPHWAEVGAAQCRDLLALLAPAAVRAEHIGSTAIPGMAAKDLIDLQISVTDLDDAVAAFDDPLAAIGFKRLPYDKDHVPAYLDDDPGKWVKRLWVRRGHAGQPNTNLHVRLVGSPNERLALLFRDWFRAHPEAIPAYARFKQSLAKVCTDVEVYSDVKDPVVDLIIGQAETWAAQSGWVDSWQA